jgi:tetrapyrrole methylase family protein/MazG family protein
MELQRFRETVRRLREECPWDREQTHQSLVRYVLEEAAEVVEAIEALDEDTPGTVDALCDELGDLLLQVFLHAAIAEQEGWFSVADVAMAVNEKMVRRHPHVFSDVVVADADEVARNWERIKAEERVQPEG